MSKVNLRKLVAQCVNEVITEGSERPLGMEDMGEVHRRLGLYTKAHPNVSRQEYYAALQNIILQMAKEKANYFSDTNQ